MSFSLECSCGRGLTVSASQAGTEVRCGCGALLRVPSLSRLREAGGRGPYEAGTIDTIQRMLQGGELPWGNACAVSREPTGDILDLCVQAERVYRSQDQQRYLLLGLLISPLLLLGLFQRPRPDVGRETIVPTPLRVSRRLHPSLVWASQRKLRRLLRTVPIYAKLLDEYPRAQVFVGDPHDA